MLARQSLLAFLNSILGALLGFVALFAIARYMGPTPMGMFAFALSVVGFGNTLCDLGVQRAHVKRISEGADLAGCMVTLAILKSALTALVVLGAAAAIWIWQATIGFTDAVAPIVLWAALGFLVLSQVRVYFQVTFQGLKMPASIQAISFFQNVGQASLAVGVALYVGFRNGRWVPLSDAVDRIASAQPSTGHLTAGEGAALLVVAYAAASFVSITVGWMLYRRHRLPRPRLATRRIGSYLRFALPLAMLAFVAPLATQMDTIMISYFWSAADAGFYYGAKRIAFFLMALPSAVMLLFFPLISELAALRQREGLQNVVRSTQRYMTMVLAPIVMLAVVYSAEGTRIILGPAYGPSGPMTAVLAIYALVTSAVLIAGNVVQGLDRPRIAAVSGLSVVVVNVVLNLFLIPSSILGIPLAGLKGLGAAMATLLAQLIGLAILGVAVARSVGRPQFTVSNLKHLIAAGITGALLWLAKDPLLGGGDRIWELLIAAGIALPLYGVMLLLFRDLTRGDWLLVRDLVHPGRMVAFVRNELVPEDD